MNEKPETLTAEDLDRVFFRAQDTEGHWKTVSAKDATDAQFEAWITTRINVHSDPGDPWTPEARVNILNIVQKQQTLYMLKKDAPPAMK